MCWTVTVIDHYNYKSHLTKQVDWFNVICTLSTCSVLTAKIRFINNVGIQLKWDDNLDL